MDKRYHVIRLNFLFKRPMAVTLRPVYAADTLFIRVNGQRMRIYAILLLIQLLQVCQIITIAMDMHPKMNL